jgi:hypothetical protein
LVAKWSAIHIGMAFISAVVVDLQTIWSKRLASSLSAIQEGPLYRNQGSDPLRGQARHATKVMVAMFGLFAEVERDLVSERTKKGLAAARTKGRLLGCPKGSPGPPKLDGKEREIQMLLEKEVSKDVYLGTMTFREPARMSRRG